MEKSNFPPVMWTLLLNYTNIEDWLKMRQLCKESLKRINSQMFIVRDVSISRFGVIRGIEGMSGAEMFPWLASLKNIHVNNGVITRITPEGSHTWRIESTDL